MSELLLATHNAGKIREYRLLLAGLDYKLLTPADLGLNLSVAEEGSSFEENALAKVRAYGAESHRLTLAEDSGLMVDALGGEPGVRSARYAGEGASDAARISLVLERLWGVPWEKRTARFRCVIALAWPQGRVELCLGECLGYITLEPRGEHGFGYDPIFFLPEMDKTMAELPMEVKNRLSHRAQAARQARRLLEERALEEIRR